MFKNEKDRIYYLDIIMYHVSKIVQIFIVVMDLFVSELNLLT